MYDGVIMAHTHRIATVAALLFVSLPARGQSPGVKPESIRFTGHRFVADLTDGGHAELTLDPRLQTSTDDVLRTFQIPYAGAVVVSIPDGRVLAMVGRSAADSRLGPADLALRAWAPSASVFKVVSATALVESGGVTGATRVCYHGGVSAVLPDNLVDIPAIDKSCATLAYGIGKSQNAIIAKLVTEHLTPADLLREGRDFGFGEAIPFEIPVEPSHLDVPANNKLEMARASAGFWHSTLSPMHAALLAATIANRGEMPTPTLVERAVDGSGRVEQLAVAAPRHVADPEAAADVGRMMELTTRIGTAKGTFRNKRGQRLLPVEVAGKTGTLNAETDHGPLGYSWFVGYAPADHPTIAFAVVLGNAPNWRIKATYVGRHIVSEYLNEKTERSGTHLVAAR
jgi:cell division protein FtsI/penicillin-binding protein 2